MSLDEHLSARVERCIVVLGLPPACGWVLEILMRLDLDPELHEQVRNDDIHHRTGVLAWIHVADSWTDSGQPLEEVERAVYLLAEWELIQIVGRRPGDPSVPGASALRLTHWGRVVTGLAPSPQVDELAVADDAMPWVILHGTSREALLLAAEENLGRDAWWTLVAPARPEEVGHACGQLAERLCQAGGCVVDAFHTLEGLGTPAVRELVRRTLGARVPRVMLVRDPAAIRDLAHVAGARLVWVEPRFHTRRDGVILDQRVTGLLERDGEVTAADLCGVPDSEIANPRRVDTTLDHLLLPREIRAQLDQSLQHARYRLESEGELARRPGGGRGYRLLLSGLPGTGKSLSAEALANALGRPLIQLDLSSVLSKWLGETEKLLAQVFDVAEVSGSVLVLDEAEALFRQRDQKHGGGGALATGVAYLLTRLDRFSGVLIATTNRSRDMDEAFFRRFDDFLVLPIPDVPTRDALWRRMLALELEEAGDGAVDVPFLAESFAISGGLIRGASIRAVAWARGLDRPLTTAVLLASLSRELSKSDRSTAKVLVEPYREEVAALLRGDAAPTGKGGE